MTDKSKPQNSATGPLANRGIKVLAADDNEVDLNLVKAILESIGVSRVDTATDGSIAHLKLSNSVSATDSYNLVITDWHMPSINGLSLLKIIRDIPEYSKVPVIILTGVSDQHQVIKALHAGASDYILKPAVAAVFADKLQKFFPAKG